MEALPLSEFIKKSNGQPQAAGLIGCHQTALSAAIRKGRNIFIQREDGQVVGAYEVKPALNLPYKKQKALSEN